MLYYQEMPPGSNIRRIVLNHLPDNQKSGLWQILLRLSMFLTDRSHMRQTQESKNVLEKLTYRQHQVMRMVYLLTRSHQEGVPLKMLAEQLQLSPGTVSEAVEKLVRKQMLDRTICPTDRRSVHIRVSQAGQAAIDLGIEQMRQDEKILLELLTEEETQTLFRLLSKLEENIMVIKTYMVLPSRILQLSDWRQIFNK